MHGGTATARWTGGSRAEISVGGYDLVADRPADEGGTGSGPRPTDLLSASIASCFTLAMTFTAAKRGVHLDALTVRVHGDFDGIRYRGFRIVVHADAPEGTDLNRLVRVAERACYVTRTLSQPPAIDVVVE